MPSPFPGMDPYLEAPTLWPDVHHELMTQVRAALSPLLRPKYVARVELRVYVSEEDDPGRRTIVPDIRIERTRCRRPTGQNGGANLVIDEPIVALLPDDEVTEAYLAISHRDTGVLVTVIEVLSPANKIAGAEGRRSFLAKKGQILTSDVHWVEIDLLRAGTASIAHDYDVFVSRAGERREGFYWPFTVQQRLPVVGIPLKGKDPDVPLDLGAALTAAYENGAYDVSIDYGKPPDPALPPVDARWANKLLRAKGLR